MLVTERISESQNLYLVSFIKYLKNCEGLEGEGSSLLLYSTKPPTKIKML